VFASSAPLGRRHGDGAGTARALDGRASTSTASHIMDGTSLIMAQSSRSDMSPSAGREVAKWLVGRAFPQTGQCMPDQGDVLPDVRESSTTAIVRDIRPPTVDGQRRDLRRAVLS
jgi:hypothetical protein